MAKKNKYTPKKPVVETIVEKIIPVPYIDTITKDSRPRDVDPSKLPKTVSIRFKGDGTGMKSNQWLGKSRMQYDFNGLVPRQITNDDDKVCLILKARKNPEAWEIVE